MKGCLQMLAIWAVLATIAVTFYLVTRADFEPEQATERTTAQVHRAYGASERKMILWYSYEVDGTTYESHGAAYESQVPFDRVEPDDEPEELGLCYVPDDPAEHVVVRDDQPCGNPEEHLRVDEASVAD